MWLKNRKVKGAAVLARTAVDAVRAQHTALPGKQLAAAMVVRLAKGVMVLDDEMTELDALIETRFQQHLLAEVIRSLPGMGARLGAEFIAATGGDMQAFGSADHLAGFAGLAPQPRDCGRVSGNLHSPRRYHRGLLRTRYLSVMASLKSAPASKAYYSAEEKRGKGTQTGSAGPRPPPCRPSVGDAP